MDSKKNSVLKRDDKPYILIGAGGHAKVIVDILSLEGKKIHGFFDDNKRNLKDLKYLGPIDTIHKMPMVLKKNYYYIIAIGDCFLRYKLEQTLGIPHESYGIAIHPTAVISTDAKLLFGTVVMANVVINTDAKVGRQVILNTGSLIEHDTIIQDFVHISPGCCLAGGVKVGEGTHVGIGTQSIQLIKIGSWSIIGAGSTIVSDIPDNVLAYGTPAKIMKEGINDEF